MCIRAAARRKCSSSATATKYLSWRSSTSATASTATPDKNRVPAIDRETKSINPNHILDRINAVGIRSGGMSFLLTCPNCGVREVTDFGFGGEINPRPTADPSFRELNDYNYFRTNVAGVQREWWFHRSGCRAWFYAERDTHHQRSAQDGAAMSRLAPQPGERIDRAKPISFTFDGKPVTAFEGDTIGSALYAAGQRTFSRSFKYHRRRGLMCVAGQCPNCICSVDGAPGARACIEPAREGLVVEHVNATPSLEHDVMEITDRAAGRSRRPASTTRRSSARAGCGRCTRRSCATPPASASCAPSSPSASGGPSTAGATPTCSSSAAAARRPRRPRPPRGRDAGADVAVLVDEGLAGQTRARRGRRRDASPAARRSAASTGSSRSGRATRCTRSAPPSSCSRPARSSSRWCSPATTCPA